MVSNSVFSDYGPTSSPRYLLGLAQLYMLDRRKKGEEEDFGVVAVDLLIGEVCKKGQLVSQIIIHTNYAHVFLMYINLSSSVWLVLLLFLLLWLKKTFVESCLVNNW